jgi:hypothetical protein
MRELFVSWWEKLKKIIADFHVLGLFMAKNYDLSEKKILSRAVAVRKICTAPRGSAFSARKLKFWLPESFEPTWYTLHSEFWN